VDLPPPPPPGFEMRAPSPGVDLPPPPPPGFETDNQAPTPTTSAPAVEGASSPTPPDMPLGDELGRSPAAPAAVPPSVPSPSEVGGEAAPVAYGDADLKQDVWFRPASDEPSDDGRPSPTAPVPDFFRSPSQSFASAAAMVSDILAAAPDAAPEPGRTEPANPDKSDTKATDKPAAPEIPITPDFFTARPRKKFGMRR
ncbi:MAG: hypothetical protein ACYCV7_09410, partial [Acidimicrobiales bacterium]